MRYLVVLGSDKKLLMTDKQLAAFVAAVDGVDMLLDKHVGENQGTHGYKNACIHHIEVKRTVDWLQVNPIADDYVDAIKLAAKLENDK